MSHDAIRYAISPDAKEYGENRHRDPQALHLVTYLLQPRTMAAILVFSCAESYTQLMSQLYLPAFFVHTLSAILLPYLQIILRNHGFSHGSTGMLLGLFEAVGIISPFVIAQAADRTGKYRRVLILVTLGTLAAAVPFSLIGQIAAVTISISALAWFFRPLWPIQDAMLMHRVGNDLWKYTKLRSFGTLGFISFSLFFQFSGTLDVQDNRSFLLWIAISCLLYIGSVAILKPDVPLSAEEKLAGTRRFWRHKGEPPLFGKKLLLGISVIAMNRLSMASITNFFSLYVTEDLGRGDLVSVLMAISATSEILFMLLAGRMLRAGVRPILLIGASSFGLCLRLMTYVLVPTLGGAVVGQLFHSLVYGLFHPAAIMFVNNNVEVRHRSMGMALYTSIGIGLPTVVGAAIGGYVIEGYGYGGLFASYTLFAITSLGMIVLFRRTLMKRALAQGS